MKSREFQNVKALVFMHDRKPRSCKVLSIELVFDHSQPCLECRPSAVILERYVMNVRTRAGGSSYSLMCI